MKKKNLLIYLALTIAAISIGAFTYVQREYILPSQASSNIQVALNWAAYDSSHVALEYDVTGMIQTADGNYNDCPIGKSIVSDAAGADITGDVYTSCRFVSEGKYAVTQFFYNDFQGKKPKQVKVQIGDLLFFSTKNNKEIHVPVLNVFTFALSGQSDLGIASRRTNTARSVANGMDMVVQKADFTPRAAKVEACLTLPDKGDWGVDAHLTMGGQDFPIDYWEIPNYRGANVFANQQRCFRFIITGVSDFRNLKSGDISFVVEKVYRNMPDCVDTAGFNKIKDELEKYSISPKPDSAGNYCFTNEIVNLGDTEANAHLFTYIQDALKEEVKGPLAITVK